MVITSVDVVANLQCDTYLKLTHSVQSPYAHELIRKRRPHRGVKYIPTGLLEQNFSPAPALRSEQSSRGHLQGSKSLSVIKGVESVKLPQVI